MFKHIWPVLLIAGLGGVARNLRVMRGNLLDVLNAQYVQTARSKGLSESKVMMKHAVPNARSIPSSPIRARCCLI
jgi:peptide/nickel transport system permease protein